MQTAPAPGSADVSSASVLLLRYARSQWRKLLLLLLLLSLAGGVLGLAARCLAAFGQGETFGVARQEETQAAAFPALTLCARRQYREEVLREAGVASARSYAMEADWLGDGETPARELYEEAVIPVEEIVSDLKVFLNTPTLDGQTIISLSAVARFCGQILFRPKEHFYFGRCHSFHAPACLQEHGISEVVFQLEEAADIYVHQEDGFFNPDTKAKLSVLPGQATKVSLSHSVQEESGRCRPGTAFDSCLSRQLGKLLQAAINCSVPWLAGGGGVCTVPADRLRAAQVFQENRKNQGGLCLPPCTTTAVQFGPVHTEVVLGAAGRAVLFFPTRVTVVSQRPLYPSLALQADLAGLAALLAVLLWAAARVAARGGSRDRAARVECQEAVPGLPGPARRSVPGLPELPRTPSHLGSRSGRNTGTNSSALSNNTVHTVSPTDSLARVYPDLEANHGRDMWKI